MQRIKKISIIEQSERAIAVLAGKLAPSAPLPSIRNLSKTLGVSTPSIQAALVQLEKRQVIAKPSANRPYIRLAKAPAEVPVLEPATTSRKLLILSSEPWESMTVSERTTLGQLTLELAQEGFSVTHEQVNFEQAMRPRKSWGRILEAQRPTHLLLMGANQALVDWCRQTRLPFLVSGHNIGVTGAMTLERDIQGGIEDAVRRLRALGHRRILVPCFNRNRKLVPIIEQAMAAGLGIHRNEVQSRGWVPYASSAAVSDLQSALCTWLERTGTTAIVTLNWRNYLLVASTLAQRGQRIPRDMSLICMSDDPDAQWCHPTPAHYSMKLSAYLRIMRKWALQSYPTPDDAIRPIELRWNAGGSVGPAPTSA
jgi:DNA-binding LacI/PurR family transcriptional regulator